jgi:nicotinate-nucleotide pyrophosphorylase (carboxylating)
MMNRLHYEDLIKRELLEDLGNAGDITTDFLIPEELSTRGWITARNQGVLAGIEAALYAFTLLSPETKIETLLKDGDHFQAGDRLASVSGSVRTLLTGERTALNLLSHLSGIATATGKMVEAVKGTGAKITDTRKTLPGLRALQKHAVRCGGGVNHRFGLDGAIMIKDNHLRCLPDVEKSIRELRERLGHTFKIEVEVDTLDQLEKMLDLPIDFPIDIVLLDNMSDEELRQAVKLVNGRFITEASGNVTIETVGSIAATGVNYISSGALTHSVPSIDIGFDFE